MASRALSRGRGVPLLARRWTERLLLVPVFVTLLAGLFSLDHSAAPSPDGIWSLAALFIAVFFGTHLLLTVFAHNADELLLPLVAMLCAIGLVFVGRLEPDFVSRQVLWYGLGVLAMLAVLIGLPDPRALRRYKYLAAGIALALMVVTAAVGREINGSKLWLGVGGFNFQVTEAMKLLLVIFLAGYLAERRLLLAAMTRRWRAFRAPALPYLLPLVIVWALAFLILVWQRDFGAMLLLAGVTLLLIYVSTARVGFLILGVLGVIANIVIAYQFFGYVRSRVDIWLHPLSDAQGDGYQIAQALFAFGNGGVLGTGIGEGFPEYIPAVHTDFVFTAVAEELGVAGAFALLALYLLLVARCLRITLMQRTDFGMLLALGLTGIIAVQTIVIVAGNLALIPITGITLPWVSYGGSSILMNFVMLGLLLRLSQPPHV